MRLSACVPEQFFLNSGSCPKLSQNLTQMLAFTLNITGAVDCASNFFASCSSCVVQPSTVLLSVVLALQDGTWKEEKMSESLRDNDEDTSYGYIVPYKGGPNSVSKSYQFQVPKTNPKLTLVPACLGHDNLSLSVLLMKEVACFQSLQSSASRLCEAWPRPRLGRKTYWHKDIARLTGTRNYIILLLKSQQG